MKAFMIKARGGAASKSACRPADFDPLLMTTAAESSTAQLAFQRDLTREALPDQNSWQAIPTFCRYGSYHG